MESGETSLGDTSALKEIAAFEGLDPQHDEIGIRRCSGSPPEYVHAQCERSEQRSNAQAQQDTRPARRAPRAPLMHCLLEQLSATEPPLRGVRSLGLNETLTARADPRSATRHRWRFIVAATHTLSYCDSSMC